MADRSKVLLGLHVFNRLTAVAGGSALVAAVAMVKHLDGWRLASIVAGFTMVFWIVGEVASIREFHFLQVIARGSRRGADVPQLAVWLAARIGTAT